MCLVSCWACAGIDGLVVVGTQFAVRYAGLENKEDSL